MNTCTLSHPCSPARRILPETLTDYRLHESNGFHNLGGDARLIRRKQAVGVRADHALDRELRARQFPPSTGANDRRT